MTGTSKGFELNKRDIWSIILVGLLVGLASTLTYVAENISHIDFGDSTLFIVPVITVAINSLVRWIKDFTKREEEKDEKGET